MKAHMFREYDIRGTYPDELNQESVVRLGRAVASYYRDHGVNRISLGRDCRLSSPDLSQWLTEGLLDSGMHVVDVGMVPTPVLYFTLHHLDVEGGIQITGSHNPPEFNGFKICLGHASVYGKEIRKIGEIAASERFARGEGSRETADVGAAYEQAVVERIDLGDTRRRVVVDGGNGTGCPVATRIYERLGFEVIPLFCEPDGHFPNHHPDPTIEENLKQMVSTVEQQGADLGIALDGDADRIGVTDPDGNVIWGDQLMIIFSRDLLTRHPGAKVIGEVKCSQTLYDDIEKHGGQGIMWKAGHSLIKSKMKEEGALLAGEMSGHLFFSERYFGYDDAIYAGARLLEILSKTDQGVRDLLDGVPKMFNTPEIRMPCPDERKFDIVKSLVSKFKKTHEVIDVDGARVLFDGGWGLIRPSNTQPVLVLRFEAENEKRLAEIQKEFMEKVEEKL
ncbi:MAG: phosphomannomutase/phosphoglucomutase [Deltaproteobacteria bacterium]|nr:phosphomannomutase/phosphoglucomutase [Deltaproteobacteria bacterium]